MARPPNLDLEVLRVTPTLGGLAYPGLPVLQAEELRHGASAMLGFGK